MPRHSPVDPVTLGQRPTVRLVGGLCARPREGTSSSASRCRRQPSSWTHLLCDVRVTRAGDIATLCLSFPHSTLEL